MKKIITIFSTAIGVGLAIVVFAMSISYNNQHKQIHNQYVATELSIESTLDKMWKTISDEFNMSEEYTQEFKEVAKINVNAFEANGELFRLVQSNMPQIDANVFLRVMNTISAERSALKNAQDRIIDIAREHNNLVEIIPSKWFISDKSRLEYQVISSRETKEIMTTREDERSIEDLRKSN